MAEIKSIHGGFVPGEADCDLIEVLERLLSEAKRGEIRALAYAVVRANSIGTGWEGVAGTRDSVGMAISLLAARYPLAVIEA